MNEQTVENHENHVSDKMINVVWSLNSFLASRLCQQVRNTSSMIHFPCWTGDQRSGAIRSSRAVQGVTYSRLICCFTVSKPQRKLFFQNELFTMRFRLLIYVNMIRSYRKVNPTLWSILQGTAGSSCPHVEMCLAKTQQLHRDQSS